MLLLAVKFHDLVHGPSRCEFLIRYHY